jgi:DNA-binding MarR family transcriptional regulator
MGPTQARVTDRPPLQADEPPGLELIILLHEAWRSILDQVHAELARQGHPGVWAADGFAIEAIGLEGATATELGHRLGISKEAAGKTIGRLVDLGYAERSADPDDRRRKKARLTARGVDVVKRVALIFAGLRADLAREIGRDRLVQLEADLRTIAPAKPFHLDLAGWFGG